MDVQDVSGESGEDASLAQNGEVHKFRLNPQGKRIAVGEYIPPKRDIRFGSFVLARPMEVGNDSHQGPMRLNAAESGCWIFT